MSNFALNVEMEKINISILTFFFWSAIVRIVPLVILKDLIFSY